MSTPLVALPEDGDGSLSFSRKESRASSQEDQINELRQRNVRRSNATGSRKSINMNARQSVWNLPKFKKASTIREVVYENTYRMGPDENDRYRNTKIIPLMQRVLNNYLCDMTYDSKNMNSVSKKICDSIKNQAKDLEYTRYKLVVNIYIGEKNNSGNSVSVASRALWMPDMGDNFAEARYENETLWALSTFHAVYFD